MTVEAYVLRPEFAELFTDEEQDVATRRLVGHGFDVEGYLARMARINIER